MPPSKEFLIQRSQIANLFNITFAPQLDESKRVFYKTRGKPQKSNREVSTTYYVNGEVVKQTTQTPNYRYLENPEIHIFYDKQSIFNKDIHKSSQGN